MDTVTTIVSYAEAHIAQVGLFSLVSFVGSLIAIPLIVLRLPEDYFLRRKKFSYKGGAYVQILHVFFIVLKNGLGLLFFLAGIVMLFLPGQGLITMVIGLSLLDFPGKHALQDALLAKVSVQNSLNWIRKTKGQRPLLFSEENRPGRKQGK